MSLRLQVIGRDGPLTSVGPVDEVTARRREEHFDEGSLVSIRPRHAPMLMLTAPGEIIWRQGTAERHVDVGRGVLEVLDDFVTVVITG